MRLIGAGAGHCYRPECATGFLWHELENGTAIKLAEVAHIVAASEEGPRGSEQIEEPELVAFENLMLLCPTCHLIVDRAPEVFTVDALRSWKESHESRVADLWGIRRYADRAGLRRELIPLLEENRQIWATYGPESEYGMLLITDVSDTWRSDVVSRILPNNARILRLLDANIHLLHPAEIATAERFRLHARALEGRHLGGVVNPAAPRFPTPMNTIAEG